MSVEKTAPEAVIAVTEVVFDRMEQYFDAAKHVIEQYGGDVAELGLNALRVGALSEILFPVVSTVFLLVLIKHALPAYRWGAKPENNSNGLGFFIPLFLGGGHLLLLFLAIKYSLNIWAWVGIFYPELYAVHKFILT